MSNPFWDERYGRDDFVYGTEPNDLLRDEAARIPAGPVLCLAEGEGRNAVYLAKLGHAVTAVDYSAQGLRKAERLARERGASLTLVEADLADYELGRDAWSGIVSFWAHTPPAVRARVHAQVVRALVPGGVFVLEVYRPEQLAHGTGGPKDVTLLPTLAALRAELAGLDLVIARESDREIHEGLFHGGPSATVQIVAVRR